jgi:hypothetical protein
MTITEDEPRIDPFTSCISIASLCHLTYLRNFMKSESIALINDNGFDPTQNYSDKQMLWLKYISEAKDIFIQHCFNGKEFKVGNYPVDGFCPATNTVYEFYGCYFHGCKLCCANNSYNSFKKTTNSQLYTSTEARATYVRKYHNLVEIWEHDWDLMAKTNSKIQAFLKNQLIRRCLKPRDALYGGQTNAARLYYRVNNNEKISYMKTGMLLNILD